MIEEYAIKSLIEMLRRRAGEYDAVTSGDCTAQEESGGNYDDAWDAGFDSGERSMAKTVLKVINPRDP